MNLRDAIQEARMGKNCSLRCPAHEDHNPSLSVRPGRDGRVLVKCHSGCATELVLAAGGSTWSDICAPKKSMAAPPYRPFVVRRADCPLDDADRQAKRARWPEFETPTVRDLDRIASIRGLGRDGLELAVVRGILWVIPNYSGHRCWVVTDSARIAAQARRMDGLKFETNKGPTKSLTLPGSIASWPVGLAELRDEHKSILLTEGGPDLLAACHFIVCEGRQRDAAAVGILGAGCCFPASLVRRFARRLVRIAQHADDKGEEAAKRWQRQLRSHAERVDGIDFKGLRQHDGNPVKDLNDLARIHADDFDKHRWIWNLLP